MSLMMLWLRVLAVENAVENRRLSFFCFVLAFKVAQSRSQKI